MPDAGRATDLPVSADLERGFADDPDDVAQTVRLAVATGLAGCSIENHTGDPANPIYDDGLAVERVAAAVEAARALSPNFVLTARCENLLWGRSGGGSEGRCDLDFVIRRLLAFEAVGADVLYAPGLSNLDDISLVCRSVYRPVNVVMGLSGSTLTVAELAEAGVARISIGSTFARLAYGGLVTAAREMREAGSFTFASQAMDFQSLDRLFRT